MSLIDQVNNLMEYNPDNMTIVYNRTNDVILLGKVDEYTIMFKYKDEDVEFGTLNVYERGGASIALSYPLNFKHYKEIEKKVEELIKKEDFDQVDEWKYN